MRNSKGLKLYVTIFICSPSILELGSEREEYKASLGYILLYMGYISHCLNKISKIKQRTYKRGKFRSTEQLFPKKTLHRVQIWVEMNYWLMFQLCWCAGK